MKTALVTGASSGIGAATALALHGAGYTVYAAARRVERMQDLRELGITTLKLDITDEASVNRAVKTIGRIDVLVNNAGYGSYGAFEEVSLTEARQQMEVNIFGLARLTQLVIPGMRQRRQGTIISIASMGGKFGEAFGSWYHATKYALEGLSDSLALELKPFGVQVITIEPGLIKTEWASIAADHMMEVSGKGPYRQLIQKKAAGFKRLNNSPIASRPEVVADKVVKILAKDKPRLRYAIGGGAKPILYLRWLLTDRMFYRIFSKFS